MNGSLSLIGKLWSGRLNHASHGEKFISAIGGFIGIIAVLWVSGSVLDHHGAAMVIASMGATAVLLFAVPHGALSQPWPVVGGHLISAFIGVACYRYIADPYIAGAVAVGLAIGAMYYLRCLHPPTPVLENVLVLLAAAVAVNLPFRWRRYPVGFSWPSSDLGATIEEKTMIAHSDLVYALSQLDSFIDVSEQDLVRIYTLAVHHSTSPVPCHQHGRECARGCENCVCRQLMGAQG